MKEAIAQMWRQLEADEGKPKVMPISLDAWEAFRSVYRSLGPRHRNVDHWRHDLKWNVPEHVIANYLAPERAKLTAGNKEVH